MKYQTTLNQISISWWENSWGIPWEYTESVFQRNSWPKIGFPWEWLSVTSEVSAGNILDATQWRRWGRGKTPGYEEFSASRQIVTESNCARETDWIQKMNFKLNLDPIVVSVWCRLLYFRSSPALGGIFSFNRVPDLIRCTVKIVPRENFGEKVLPGCENPSKNSKNIHYPTNTPQIIVIRKPVKDLCVIPKSEQKRSVWKFFS